MAQGRKPAKAGLHETLLLAISEDGNVRIGLPPRHHDDSFYDRATVLGQLRDVSHVVSSPEGELFCIYNGELYKGPLPSNRNVDWFFSAAKRVGKLEWGRFKMIFFHPNGELFAITKDGDFYQGPQPNNENVSWMYDQAEKIGVNGWDQCEASFFHPDGSLYVVNKENKLVKGKSPTSAQGYKTWLGSATVVGECGWLSLTHFISFDHEGKLWSVDKGKGNIYRGIIPSDGRYVDNAEHLGWSYHIFPLLSLTIDKTISNVQAFDFLIEDGKIVSENPEVIKEGFYDNRGSTAVLKHNFKFDKVVKVSSSFSHEHGFTFEVGAEITFTAGIPFIAKTEAKLSMNFNTSHKWSFTEKNETEVRYSSESVVEIPPGKAIRVTASVVRAELVVPYRAKVKTLFGLETEVEGTWNGATLYNMRVTQKDYEG